MESAAKIPRMVLRDGRSIRSESRETGLSRIRSGSIGDAINGRHAGRTSLEEVTIFDGTGVGLQDIAVASVATKVALEKGLAARVDL